MQVSESLQNDILKKSLLNLPLRTRRILEDAKVLEKDGFFSVAILRYANYLEHFLMVATVSYHEERNINQVQNILECFSAMKSMKMLTFDHILKQTPNKILNPEIRKMCKEIKNIRNTVAAHDYFVIALDKTHRRNRQFQDVNRYRKFIRNMYKLIKSHKRISEVESFLVLNHPLTIYSHIEESAYRIEMVLMKNICKYVGITTISIAKKIEHNLYKKSPRSNLDKFVIDP